MSKSDSDAQKKKLREDPELYLEYRKMIESEISERFRFILKNGPDAVQARNVSVTVVWPGDLNNAK
jgi:hypothetical protein